MLKTIPVFSAAIALSTALVFAQGRGTPPDPQTMAQRRMNFLAVQLSLTDAQRATALSIYTNGLHGEPDHSIQSTDQPAIDFPMR